MEMPYQPSPHHGFLIGAAKSGTTSLSSWLADNPQVCMSRPKEPIFFEADFERGLNYYHDTYFPHYKGEHFVFDARHRNMFLPYVPQRIASVDPSPFLVAILREPVKRAHSHWWHHARREQDPLPFEEAVEQNLERLADGQDFTGAGGVALWLDNLTRRSDGLTQYGFGVRTYVDSGYYAPQLKRYFDLFGREQVHIIFLEEVTAEPAIHLQQLVNFLRLDLHSSTLPIKNRSEDPPSRSHRARHLVAAGAEKFLPDPVRKRLRGISFDEGDVPAPSPYITQHLREHYAPYNKELQDLLGRRLPSSWVTQD